MKTRFLSTARTSLSDTCVKHRMLCKRRRTHERERLLRTRSESRYAALASVRPILKHLRKNISFLSRSTPESQDPHRHYCQRWSSLTRATQNCSA